MSLYVQDTAGKEKGLFTDSEIEKGQVILVFEGDIVNDDELDSIRKMGDPRVDDYTMQLDTDVFFYVSRGIGRFVNHSCEPNSGVKIGEGVQLVAMRDIHKGEEISFDYSTITGTDDWVLECKCGSENCRKTIGNFKYLPREIKQRYIELGIAPPFLSHETTNG